MPRETAVCGAFAMKITILAICTTNMYGRRRQRCPKKTYKNAHFHTKSTVTLIGDYVMTCWDISMRIFFTESCVSSLSRYYIVLEFLMILFLNFASEK